MGSLKMATAVIVISGIAVFVLGNLYLVLVRGGRGRSDEGLKEVAAVLDRVEQMQRTHGALLEALVQTRDGTTRRGSAKTAHVEKAASAGGVACYDHNELCPMWLPCCPGGDGQGVNCGKEDCSDPGKTPCEGKYTKTNCPVTCATCPPGARVIPPPPKP
eukprot:Hpha_TRINITY_DN8067_c0_g1::TRINITY_DN8067_c0_g1_i1::g.140126::m.140126